MKILAIGHSMVHPRQQWFFKKVGKLAGYCTIVGPRFWHTLGMNNLSNSSYQQIGLPAMNDQDIFAYWLTETRETIEDTKPDIVYCQAELRAKQTMIALQAAKANKIPFVVFIWENIFTPKTREEIEILEYSAMIICGNKEAKSLIPEKYQQKCRVLPQVGIELDYFKPYYNIEKNYDVIFCGRPVIEKGIEIIKDGCNGLNCSLKIIQGQDYERIPKMLCEGKIFVSLPMTTPLWKEQSGSYSNLEAMACGLPVITTRCGAIPEYLEDAALYCEENNVASFVENLKKLVFDAELRNTYIDLGLKQAKKFSNEEIAKKLIGVLKECI